MLHSFQGPSSISSMLKGVIKVFFSTVKQWQPGVSAGSGQESPDGRWDDITIEAIRMKNRGSPECTIAPPILTFLTTPCGHPSCNLRELGASNSMKEKQRSSTFKALWAAMPTLNCRCGAEFHPASRRGGSKRKSS